MQDIFNFVSNIDTGSSLLQTLFSLHKTSWEFLHRLAVLSCM